MRKRAIIGQRGYTAIETNEKTSERIRVGGEQCVKMMNYLITHVYAAIGGNSVALIYYKGPGYHVINLPLS